ncbi:1797_t:CDS:1, partial [Paraglomus brasilianum]
SGNLDITNTDLSHQRIPAALVDRLWMKQDMSNCSDTAVVVAAAPATEKVVVTL